jgi:hypothetical protein
MREFGLGENGSPDLRRTQDMIPIDLNCDMSHKFRSFIIEDEFCVLFFADIFPLLSTLG